MKFLITSALFLASISSCMTGFCTASEPPAGEESETTQFTIGCAPELMPLAQHWATAYKQVTPALQINLQELPAATRTTEGISLVSGNSAPATTDAWRLCLGHQAIVALVSEKNPNLKEILQKGFQAEQLLKIFNGDNLQDIHPVLTDQPEVNAGIAAFIKSSSPGLTARKVKDVAALTLALQQDPKAVGFCMLSDLTAEGQTGLPAGLRLAPIDKNSNGRLDAFENIYDNTATLSRGIWIGKYPRELSGSLYAVSNNAPTDAAIIAFLSWITSDGSVMTQQQGFTALTSLEKESNLAALSLIGKSNVPASEASFRIGPYILLAVLIIAAISLLVILFFRRTHVSETIHPRPVSLFRANTLTGPHGYYFDKSHTWAYMEKNGNIRMGIDDFLQHITGSISRMVLKENGTEVRRGEKILTLVKDGKKLNIYAPVSGIIRSRNNMLQKNASVVNFDPYQAGWIYEIEPKNWLREIQFMFMGESYYEWMKEEFVRLRRFFDKVLHPAQNETGTLILQDGGELKDHILADLGPEIWEEFQTAFIDKSR
jgi:glycine cleavage system H lipoate-binding protein/ABC-type phosphate transport system substrate-binding protein